jgi:hypothetical protein
MNRKEIYRRGFTYVVSRRIVQFKDKTVLRVRVAAYKGLDTRTNPVWNEYRDYVSVAEGDSVFHKHIEKIGVR